MEKEDVEDETPGDSDEEGKEIVALRAQDDESKVRSQEKIAVFEKCILHWWGI